MLKIDVIAPWRGKRAHYAMSREAGCYTHMAALNGDHAGQFIVLTCICTCNVQEIINVHMMYVCV